MQEKLDLATKNILENNLKLLDSRLLGKKIVLVYDTNSKLSTMIWESYSKNLENFKNTQIIIFDETLDKEKENLKNSLLSLEEFSTVILVQSTSFRLDDFRIRLNLMNANIWCLEHYHLAYIKKEQYENYIDAIEYKTPYYLELSNKLEKAFNKANSMKVICNDWSIFEVTWWFEDLKKNTWDYEISSRWWTFPIWEVFNEAKIFDNVNWELAIYSYPDENFQVVFLEKPFVIKIEKSMIVSVSENTPKSFLDLLEKIKKSENNEVMIRELGFGLNTWITREKKLSDVNAFERIAGFHISLGKKHNIYRKKLDNKVVQRYHIDIFPDVKEIIVDKKIIFENERFII